MSWNRARIVEAMIELKERRDTGEFAHEILDEVAETHNVSSSLLRERAEASWGSPLESDPQRHSTHFEHAHDKSHIADQARKLARLVWEANLIGLKEFSFWQVAWEKEIADVLARANLNDPDLEETARSAFMIEAARLEKGRPPVNAAN